MIITIIMMIIEIVVIVVIIMIIIVVRAFAFATPFVRAFALQSSSRNCSPAPDVVFSKPIFSPVFFSGGAFFHRHLYELQVGAGF